MSEFTAYFYFDGEESPATQADLVTNAEKRTYIHDDLSPRVARAVFRVKDDDIVTQLLSTYDNIRVDIEKEESLWFRGTLLPETIANVTRGVEEIELEIVGESFKLTKAFDADLIIRDAKLCDPGDTDNSLLHLIADEFSVSVSTTNIETLSDEITVARFEANKDGPFAALARALFEHLHIFRDSEDGAEIEVVELFPQEENPTAITNTDVVDEIRFKSDIRKYGGVRTFFYPVRELEDVQLFKDTTEGDDVNEMNVSLTSEEEYPEGDSATNPIYSRYELRDSDYELLDSENQTLDSEGTASLKVDTLQTLRARVIFEGPGTVTQFHITGDATVRDRARFRSYVRINDPKPRRMKEEETLWVETDPNAETFTLHLSEYYRYAKTETRFVSHAASMLPGNLYELTETETGFSGQLRVMEVRENRWGHKQVFAETWGEFSFSEAPDTEDTTEPVAEDERTVIRRETQDKPTYDEIQGGYDEGGGTTTPVAPMLEARVFGDTVALDWDEQLALTNLQQYETQVSDDQSDWYSLQFDGMDWKDTLGGSTIVQRTSALLHTDVPYSGTEDEPTGRTLFYRVRQRTKDGVTSDWSNEVEVTTRTIVAGDLEALTVTAAKVDTAVLNALIARIKDSIFIGDDTGFTGFTGSDNESPSNGDRRLYLDGDELRADEYDGSAWQQQWLLGGADNELTGISGLAVSTVGEGTQATISARADSGMRARLLLQADDDSDKGWNLVSLSTGDQFEIQTSGGATRIVVKQGGNIGIIEENPQALLHITAPDAATYPRIRLEDDLGNLGYMGMYRSGLDAGVMQFGPSGTASLLLITDGTNRLEITGSGKTVVKGLLTAESDLDAAGDVNVDGSGIFTSGLNLGGSVVTSADSLWFTGGGHSSPPSAISSDSVLAGKNEGGTTKPLNQWGGSSRGWSRVARGDDGW